MENSELTILDEAYIRDQLQLAAEAEDAGEDGAIAATIAAVTTKYALTLENIARIDSWKPEYTALNNEPLQRLRVAIHDPAKISPEAMAYIRELYLVAGDDARNQEIINQTLSEIGIEPSRLSEITDWKVVFKNRAHHLLYEILNNQDEEEAKKRKFKRKATHEEWQEIRQSLLDVDNLSERKKICLQLSKQYPELTWRQIKSIGAWDLGELKGKRLSVTKKKNTGEDSPQTRENSPKPAANPKKENNEKPRKTRNLTQEEIIAIKKALLDVPDEQREAIVDELQKQYPDITRRQIKSCAAWDRGYLKGQRRN